MAATKGTPGKSRRRSRTVAYTEAHLVAAAHRELAELYPGEDVAEHLERQRVRLKDFFAPELRARKVTLSLKAEVEAALGLSADELAGPFWGFTLSQIQGLLHQLLALIPHDSSRGAAEYETAVRKVLVANRVPWEGQLPTLRTLALYSILLGVRTAGPHKTVAAAIEAEAKALGEAARRLARTAR